MFRFICIFGLICFFKAYAIEKIEVTGSRVKRIDIEGPTPLIVLDTEDLEKSGYNSVGDVLRDTTVAPFGLGREHSGSSVAGESFVSVHGATTLILINGERVVEDPNAEAVDLNLIPIFAVERIEIVKDGASALYGSDALGGVINFIMKENFEGAKFYGRYSQPYLKGGSRLEAAVITGKTYSKGSFTGVLQYRLNDKIFAADREWSTGLKSPTSPYGAFYIEGGESVLNPLCPEEQRIGSDCYYNYSQHSTTLPAISQISSYLRADYKWNGIKLYNQSIVSYKDVTWVYAPLPGAVTLPAGHLWSRFPSQAGDLVYRFEDAGNRDVQTQSFVFDLTFGAKGYLSSTWDWDFSTKIARVSKKDTSYNLLLTKEITDLIAGGHYDPFALRGARGDLSGAKYDSVDENFSHVVASTLDLSGEYGPFGVALGAQAFYTDYEEIADENAKAGVILSSVGSDGSGERSVFSIYQEVVWPYSTFEVQTALRSDYYSDFGFTINPKGAFRWQPASSFLMRGSVGTSFIAPTMHDLYGTLSIGYPTIIDTVACYNELNSVNAFQKLKTEFGKDDEFGKEFLIDQKKTFNDPKISNETKEELKVIANKMTAKTNEFCSPRQYVARSGGNEDLKETKAVVASLGTVWQANTNTSFSMDAWYIKTNGSPASGISKSAVDAELKFGKDYVTEKGVLITRDGTKDHNPILHSAKDDGVDEEGKPKQIVGIDTALLNIGGATLAGVDATLEFTLPKNIYGGKSFFQSEGTFIVSSSSQSFPGLDFKDNIGKAGLPRWRVINTLGWRNKEHEIAFKAHTVASVGKAANELESIPNYTRFDLAYQWAFSSKTNFNIGWSNLLLSVPPQDDTIKQSSKIDESLFEVRGSYVYFGFNRVL